MRIAFTQSVPIGAASRQRASSEALPRAAMAAPPARPRDERDEDAGAVVHGCAYIIRSPPLMSSDAPVM